MIKAVLFDLDDTLRSFMVTKTMACEAAIDAMIDAGLKMDREKALDRLFNLYGKYGIEHKTIFQKFLKNVNGKIDYKILAAGIVAYREVADSRAKPFPGVENLLKELVKRKIKLGVVSNAPSIKAWVRLTESGLRDYFDHVVTLGDSRKRKPHPKPFSMAMELMKIRPEEIVFVGDDLECDMIGAKRIGMKTALADYETKHEKKSIEKAEPDYVLKKPMDLMRIVKKG